jgi:hypothetical protein
MKADQELAETEAPSNHGRAEDRSCASPCAIDEKDKRRKADQQQSNASEWREAERRCASADERE